MNDTNYVEPAAWGRTRPNDFLALLVEHMSWCGICGWGNPNFIWVLPPLWHECDTSGFVEKVGLFNYVAPGEPADVGASAGAVEPGDKS